MMTEVPRCSQRRITEFQLKREVGVAISSRMEERTKLPWGKRSSLMQDCNDSNIKGRLKKKKQWSEVTGVQEPEFLRKVVTVGSESAPWIWHLRFSW